MLYYCARGINRGSPLRNDRSSMNNAIADFPRERFPIFAFHWFFGKTFFYDAQPRTSPRCNDVTRTTNFAPAGRALECWMSDEILRIVIRKLRRLAARILAYSSRSRWTIEKQRYRRCSGHSYVHTAPLTPREFALRRASPNNLRASPIAFLSCLPPSPENTPRCNRKFLFLVISS